MIFHTRDQYGAFVAGDTETGRTAYAYSSSPNSDAARKAPREVAAEMMAHESKSLRSYLSSRADYDARNWERLGVLA